MNFSIFINHRFQKIYVLPLDYFRILWYNK